MGLLGGLWDSRLYSRLGPATCRFGWGESEQITRTVAELTTTYRIPVPYASA